MSSFNGSGVFSISGTGLPYVFNTTISETVANQLNTDLATGLSNCICKDGQSTPTANIKLGGFKLTNVGAATATNDALTYGTGANQSSLLAPTRQVLLSGSGATYTTPSLCRQLRIRMVGAGGGGAQNSTNAGDGSAGGTTTFNSINAAGGGLGSHSGNGGAGGTGGSGGSSPNTFRAPGGPGQAGYIGAGNSSSGGNSALGGGGTNQGSAAANSGGGGAGQVSASGNSGGGGGSGEYVELIINSPSATYTYTIGAGGAGASGAGSGGSGIIIVDEFY